MTSSPSASGLLPMPGTPAATWAVYRSRLASVFRGTDVSVVIAFWLFGLINNVLYVIILSAAQDLVGTNVPKGVVLLADVVPSFLTKLVAPYFIHAVPYPLRILAFVALSSSGMLLIALTPSASSVAVKLVGVVLASLSSGGGELSFLGLTHYYGHTSLAAWGSGTGGAGLIGAGLYVLLTDWIGLSVKTSLLASACLPAVMVLSFFVVLPHGPLRDGATGGGALKEYDALPGRDEEEEDSGINGGISSGGTGDHTTENIVEDMSANNASASLLAPGPSVASTAFVAQDIHDDDGISTSSRPSSLHQPTFAANLRRARRLFFPYMLPLLLVYVAEYTINQGVSPTLLFPLPGTPFTEYRAFYPFYGFLYQLGVFISRSSTPFIRIHHLYLPSFLQVGNLGLLTLHALFDFIPSVYVVFVVVFWEGLLGGAVYVNTFAEIMENVPVRDREFSLGATSVSDSGGICLAGFVGMAMEVWLCNWQVRNGRDYCKRIETS